MVFQGEVLPISALLERAQTAPVDEPGAGVGGASHRGRQRGRCAVLLAADTPEVCWGFGILQTLDDYTSTLRRGGPTLAAEVFAAEPAPTGSTRLDAAFAALADHLAERDGWPAPAWAAEPRHVILPDAGELAYTWSMTPTAAEVLDAAKALPREQRAEVVQEIIATLGTPDVADEARLAALRAAVDAGIASLNAGKGIRIPAGGLREYLRERGRLATERASAKIA